MKTLIIYNATDDDLQYCILEGDYSRFNGVAIGSGENDELEDEASMLMYDKQGNKLIETTSSIDLLESKQWDKVAVINMIM
jgi:hypothetical protein